MYRASMLVLLLAVPFMGACALNPAPKDCPKTTSIGALTPSPELAAQVRVVYAAMMRGDTAAVEGMYSLAEGSLFIGTSSSEYWTDSAKHNADVRPYWKLGNLVIEPGDIRAVSLGDVGITVDRPTFRLKDGTSFKTRVTLVWRREGQGVWKVVHSHASVGQR